MKQEEQHQINEKDSICIQIESIKNRFLIRCINTKSPDESFNISLNSTLMISLFKEYEKKSNEFISKDELKITSVNFDFYRANSLYFDIYFNNLMNQQKFHARLYVFYKNNNHGNSGEIYNFNLIHNRIQ